MVDVEKLKEISDKILPSSEILPDKGLYGSTVISFKGEKIMVFDNYDRAENANFLRFTNYFKKHPQQLIYLWEEYAENENEKKAWKNFIFEPLLGKWLVDNFDKFTSGHYKNSPYRKEILDNLRKNPIFKMEQFVGGDIGKLSTQLLPFFDMTNFVYDLQEMMESRIYEYDGFYFLPMVELPE